MSGVAIPVAENQTHEAAAYNAKAYAAQSATSSLAPFSVPRRELRPDDVQIQIQFCGVCHSDLHQVRNEWQSTLPTIYPVVPGHEIIGRVSKTGSVEPSPKPHTSRSEAVGITLRCFPRYLPSGAKNTTVQ